MRSLQKLLFSISILALLGASTRPLQVVYAGSLVTPMERRIAPDFGRRCGCEVQTEGKGSVLLAKMIADGLRSPDVFISADTAVLDTLLHHAAYISWYATFGTARLVLGYSPHSRFAGEFARVRAGKLSIARLLLEPGLRIGRTDPRLDPKGYRTLLAMRLEARLAHAPPLATLLERAEEPALPEEQLLVRLENGDLDVAFLYSTESQSRHIPVLELPDGVNLGHPALAARYATASVTVDGKVYRGEPIAYAITILNAAPNPQAARAFVQYLLHGAGRAALSDAGLTFIQPAVTGDAAAAATALRRF